MCAGPFRRTGSAGGITLDRGGAPIAFDSRVLELELCVLALLSKQDSYAYEIASSLADSIGMGEGTIYPLMRRLQNDGLVETYLVESSSGP